MNVRLVFTLCLAGLAMLFIIQNVAVVEVRFLFWSLQMSRALFMFLLLAIGVGVGWLLHAHLKHRDRG